MYIFSTNIIYLWSKYVIMFVLKYVSKVSMHFHLTFNSNSNTYYLFPTTFLYWLKSKFATDLHTDFTRNIIRKKITPKRMFILVYILVISKLKKKIIKNISFANKFEMLFNH